MSFDAYTISNGPKKTKYQKRDKGAPAPVAAKPSDNRPALRTCLCCGEKFKSTGFGNRMCQRCLDAPWRDV